MTSPTILWLRRDLRLSDHPALSAAVKAGPVIPVFIQDEQVARLGAAPKWRLGLGLETFARSLAAKGSRLILRRGAALEVLRALIAETGARAVYWSRLYEADAVARDSVVKSALKSEGIDARSFGGHLLFEPWTVQTKTGGPYRVYSPFWRAVKDHAVETPLPAPGALAPPNSWPASDTLDQWRMGCAMRRGAAVVRPHLILGEAAGRDRLNYFTEVLIDRYQDDRNRPDLDATSGLSQTLALGEISPHQCWHAGLRALHEGRRGAETFLKELVWREFAYHLLHHSPHMAHANWREGWDRFPWSEDSDAPGFRAWCQGRTGIPFVDAGMREMYVTGRMHNRTRMIVASYLTKHMLTHWRLGLKWFEDCLVDWDPASNAMGWQWVAGSGPDAAPYFRIFNPVSQLEKFDPDGRYAHRWIAEDRGDPHPDALSYFDATPRSWSISPADPYPHPIVGLDEGRKRALAAYEARDF